MAKQSQSEQMAHDLAKPFAPNELLWSPGMRPNPDSKRVFAIPRASHAAVIARLNDACGVGGWSESHTLLPSGEVECRLSILFGDQWVAKAGVSEPAKPHEPAIMQGADKGIRYKPCYFESLASAAFKFGVGAYLLRLTRLVGDYDPAKGTVAAPQLPAWAIPEEWQDTGTQVAESIRKLADRIATETAAVPDHILLQLVSPHGYSVTTDLSKIPRVHSRIILVDAHARIQELASRKSKPQTV